MMAETIARALGGRKEGRNWMARCVAHKDRTPSLSIRDKGDRVLVHCFAGCPQAAVISALKARGLWHGSRGIQDQWQSPSSRPQRQTDIDRSAYPLKIWQSARPADGTLVETYLRSRGLTISSPPTLGFHPYLKHRDGNWPAMIALVTRGTDNALLGIQRTFLASHGQGKAPVEPQKMMLGPCRGGAVRLASPTDVLLIGEGIETCLSAMQATGLPAWAALSTSGLLALNLPEDVRNVIVLADGDDAGETAARESAMRWHREGRMVKIARAPRGSDFNDVLRG